MSTLAKIKVQIKSRNQNGGSEIDKGKVKVQTPIKIKINNTQIVGTTWSPHHPVNRNDVIISFDVGIVNLAYCVMSYINNEIEVYDWGIISLANGNPKMKCAKKMKSSGAKCTRSAFYKNDKGKGECKMHGEKTNNRNVTVANITEFELKSMLFKILDSNPIFINVSDVLIEMQPNKAQEKIKGVSHALFDYYVLRGTIDNNIIYDEIKFINAKNKLTVYDGPPLSCTLKTQYARNKWYAIRYCRWILKDHVGLINFFETYGSKKDDLADCFLQGLWYLKYSKPGEKAPVTSLHQKLVYRENNRLRYKTVRARAPQKNGKTPGQYTLSNVKYLISKGYRPDSSELQSSIEFFFGDLDYFSGVLKNM